MTLYKALKDLKSCYGGDAVWTPGRWMPWVRELVPCKSGYHLCDGEYRVLRWLARDIWIADVKGEVVNLGGKVVTHQTRIVEKTAWNTEAAIAFANDCAEHVKSIASSQPPITDLYSYEDGLYRNCYEEACTYAAIASARTAVSDNGKHASLYVRLAAEAAAYASADERQWQAERLGKYLRGEL